MIKANRGCVEIDLDRGRLEWRIAQDTIEDMNAGDGLQSEPLSFLGYKIRFTLFPKRTDPFSPFFYLNVEPAASFGFECGVGEAKNPAKFSAENRTNWGGSLYAESPPTTTSFVIYVGKLQIDSIPSDSFPSILRVAKRLTDQKLSLASAIQAEPGVTFLAALAAQALEDLEQTTAKIRELQKRLEQTETEARKSQNKAALTNRTLEDKNKELESTKAEILELQKCANQKDETLLETRNDLRLSRTENGESQRRLLKLEQVLRDLTSPDQSSSVRALYAKKLQRAWRAKTARDRMSREHAEKLRSLRLKRSLRGVSQLQRVWRSRCEALRQRRLAYDAMRMAPHRPSTRYDVVYSFQSLAEFIATGKIQFLQSAESSFNISKEERYRIVAVVGLFDKGKTFLINKLFGVNLPSSKVFSTKGLSFLWIPERRMLVLDSAGVQSTVSYRAQAVEPILDAQTTESLVFEMISRIAHSMIFVVNDLTWFEQKYVAMLHQKYVQKGQSKELIVVHNLRSTEYIEEASILFERQITHCYEGKLSHLASLIFTADQGDGVPRVHHVGLCRDGSVAGERFNDKNCAWLMQMLELRDTLGENIKLSDLLCQEFGRLLPVFVNLDAPAEVTIPESNENMPVLDQSLVVEFEPVNPVQATSSDGYKEVGTLIMRDPPFGQHVVMKTRGVISPLGEIIPHDVSFEPIVNVFDKVVDQTTQRFIQVECPGVEDDDIDLEKLPNGIKIAIEKRRAIDEVSARPHPSYPIRQHHGPWERDFMFDVSEGHFDVPKTADLYKLEKGVLTVVLDWVRQNPKLKNGRRSSDVRPTGSTALLVPARMPVQSTYMNILDDARSTSTITTEGSFSILSAVS